MTDVTEAATPVEPPPTPDLAALVKAMQTEIDALKAQGEAAKVANDTFDRAPDYDESDDDETGYITMDVPQGQGLPVMRHRVAVSNWSKYEKKYGL